MIRTVIFFLTVLLLSACGQGGGDDDFQFNLGKGKTYQFNRKYIIREHSTESRSEVSCTYMAEVTEIKDDIRTLKLTCGDHQVVKYRSGSTKNTGADSVAPMDLEDVYQKVYSALNGKSFYIQVNGTGKMVQVSGLKELVFPVIDSMQMPGELRKKAKQFFLTVGEPVLARQFMQGFDIFPRRDIKTGDSWQKERQQDGIVPINVNTTYTVKDISGGKVYLRVKALMSDNGRKGELLGNYVVDRRSGLLLDADITTQFGVPVLISTNEKLIGSER